MDIKSIQQMVLLVAMIAVAIMMLLTLIVSIIGPRFTDRLIMVSAINTEVNAFMCMLLVYLGKGYIIDIALVYGMIGFLAIVILAKLKLKQYLEEHGTTVQERLKTVSENDRDN
ncbi:MAG: hypothetical protein IJR47_03585 [Clostridia bacterium]|nr:hypothetical protein [Clostridia bacterium]